jgi:hypothetical protein
MDEAELEASRNIIDAPRRRAQVSYQEVDLNGKASKKGGSYVGSWFATESTLFLFA